MAKKQLGKAMAIEVEAPPVEHSGIAIPDLSSELATQRENSNWGFGFRQDEINAIETLDTIGNMLWRRWCFSPDPQHHSFPDYVIGFCRYSRISINRFSSKYLSLQATEVFDRGFRIQVANNVKIPVPEEDRSSSGEMIIFADFCYLWEMYNTEGFSAKITFPRWLRATHSEVKWENYFDAVEKNKGKAGRKQFWTTEKGMGLASEIMDYLKEGHDTVLTADHFNKIAPWHRDVTENVVRDVKKDFSPGGKHYEKFMALKNRH